MEEALHVSGHRRGLSGLSDGAPACIPSSGGRVGAGKD